MVYELDTLPRKENTSWRCSVRCFSAKILIPSHLATTEQCPLAGTPVWDDARLLSLGLRSPHSPCYDIAHGVAQAIDRGS